MSQQPIQEQITIEPDHDDHLHKEDKMELIGYMVPVVVALIGVWIAYIKLKGKKI